MIHYITTSGIGNAWVGNELHKVQQAGVPFVLHAMRSPGLRYFKSEWAQELHRRTRTLYPLPPAGLVLSALLGPFLFGSRFFAALGNALFGRRESFRVRIAGIAHFFVACHWARGLRTEPVTHIHSQWIHSCGTIGMYGAWLLGRSFSFTGHATDLFRDRCALLDKIRRAEKIVCISSFHRDLFKKLGARDEQLVIVYCGIDVELFAPVHRAPRRSEERLRIRSSGRLVEKKGFCDLITACRILTDRGVDLECVIAGSGPLRDTLQAQIDALGLADRVSLTGSEVKQEDIPAFMHGGDVYCLPCVWASDDDVDGLPQMLMEAMACGLPVISTRLVGIPDLVVDGKTGLLVEPQATERLADAIQKLRDEPALAARLAEAGRQYVLEKFDIATCLEPLIAVYRTRLPNAPVRSPRKAEAPPELATQGAKA